MTGGACDACGRVYSDPEREHETRRRYGSWDDERPEPEPVDFDPLDAGERWEA